MIFRDYQQEAHDAVVPHLRRSLSPVCVDAATGAGKSYIIAALAASMHGISRKGILVLMPSVELVQQNVEKYLLTGNPASIFSAAAGEKNIDNPVIFGTPMSVANSIDDFLGKIAVVILDEAHATVTPTVKGIVESLRKSNDKLRIVGLTATPYRLGSGYIYRQGPDGVSHDESTAKNPYFSRCVYRVHARELIARGFLTAPVIGETGAHYDTANLETNAMRKFTADSVERAFVGKKRLTAGIMEEVIEYARDRAGVMVFASTVAHAHECLASLPAETSAVVTGSTPKLERAELLRRFRCRDLKYIVSVSTLTTGFDVPHVDLIAVLRPTESVGLFQQCIGRGLRVSPGKKSCVVLDYAENIERHCPDGDLFNPKIEAHKDGKAELREVICPQCSHTNLFALAQAGKDYDMDEHGYCVDLAGNHIKTTWDEPMPGHHGRRCQWRDDHDNRCDYRWTAKTCKACGHRNDIAARNCAKCKAELVDPNAKLSTDRFVNQAKARTEKISSVSVVRRKTKHGRSMVLANFVTETNHFRVYFFPASKWRGARRKCMEFLGLHETGQLKTVTYRINPKTGYYVTSGFNKQD